MVAEFVTYQGYSFHRFANLFPMMQEDEFLSLVENIRCHGLREKIWLFQDQILDGRNRHNACIQANVMPQYRTFTGTEEQALEAVVSWNLERRHLTSWQKAAIAPELTDLFDELARQAKQRQIESGRFAGKDKEGNPIVQVPQNFEEPEDQSDRSKNETHAKVASVLGTNRQYVYDAVKIAKQAPDVSEASKQGILSAPQAKAIAPLEPEQRTEVIKALEETPRSKRSATLSALLSSASNEWYTPSEYVEAAREVMGCIDLDPASNPLANETVKATVFYTIDNDGLGKEWKGCVFLNPPYGKDEDKNASNQAVWTEKLLSEYRDGAVDQAVLVVNAATERKWFQPLWDYPICFTDHRIKFCRPEGEGISPTNGNAIVYLGDRVPEFINTFRKFGRIVSAIDRDVFSFDEVA